LSGGALIIILGLVSAATWGAADFFGGLAAKRSPANGVVIFGHLGSLFLLLPAAIISGEPLLSPMDWLIGMLSGVAAGSGLILLYRSLADGQMSLASPVSALVAALIPVMVGFWLEGFPGYLMLTGILLALAAIWLIAQAGQINPSHLLAKLRLPLLSGILFGLFYVGIHAISSRSVFLPLVATRLGSISCLLLFTLLSRKPWLPDRSTWKYFGAISVLDTAGNLFYLLAARLGRMDLAAVLGSLYPGSTVALARLVLKERISRSQWLGVALALLALVLISL